MAKRKQAKKKKINSSEKEHDISNLASMISHSEIKDDAPPESREDEEGSPWPYLPYGVLDSIVSHLSISERIHSSRVCKYWRNILLETPKFQRPRSYGSPCLLRFPWGSKKCILVDPLRKKGEEFTLDTPNLPDNVHIACSNYGWLLLIAGNNGERVFFFNPLTQATIELPTKQFPSRFMFNFSAPPTSPDCTVVALLVSHYVSLFCHCRPGDEEWTRFVVDHNDNSFQGSYSRPLFLEDGVYHLGLDGRLGIYDLADESLCVIGKRMRKPHKSNDRYYLAKTNDGQLTSVFVDVDDGLVHVFKFDDSNEQWVKMDSIGDNLLFAGPIDCTWTKAITGVHERVYLQMIYKGEMMSFSCAQNELQPTRKIYDKDVYEFRRTACWIELMP